MVRLDLPGTLEALDSSNRQFLDAARALNATPADVAKVTRQQKRPPRISSIRQSAYSAGEQLSQPETDVARTRLRRRA